MALATAQDVETALGRPLSEEESARCEWLLEQISAKFCREAGTEFTVGEYTHRVKVNAGHVRPPQQPIISVASVVGDDGRPLRWRLRHGYVDVEALSHEFVVITYRAGYEKIPPAVVGQVADEVRRILMIDPQAAAGFQQSSTTDGPFSQSGQFAASAVGAQAMLSPDAAALARSFRRHRPNVWVCGG